MTDKFNITTNRTTERKEYSKVNFSSQDVKLALSALKENIKALTEGSKIDQELLRKKVQI